MIVMFRELRSLVFCYPLKLPCFRMFSTSKIDKKRLCGKVAIVTASTEGIGFAIAKRLGQDGAAVVVSSRKQANVDKAVDELKKINIDVTGIVCHVGNPEHRKNLVQEVVSKKGGIDILVSNAAVNPAIGRLLDTQETVWDKIFDVNVKAAFFLSQECVPHIEKRKGGGAIVYVSSIGGYTVNSMPTIAPYCISKTALLGLTKAMAFDCANRKIRVNCIAPGIIKTKFSDHLTSTYPEQILSKIPLERFGEPEDCAGVVSFLCSDDASYITGETICVTGGMSSRL